MWAGYVLIELSPSLSGGANQALLGAATQMWNTTSNNPDERTAVRVRPGGGAAIIEAQFDEGTVEYALAAIATVLQVSVAAIENDVAVTVFGGSEATKEESASACRAYLIANTAIWDSNEEQ